MECELSNVDLTKLDKFDVKLFDMLYEEKNDKSEVNQKDIDEVKECAVFGIENEKIEEEVVLVYSGTKELAKNEIIFELKKHLPSYMIPTTIIFKANMPIDSKDKSKIDKGALKEEMLKLK